MDNLEKVLEGILMQLAQLDANVASAVERMDAISIDLEAFSERFEDVVTQLEDERRLDLARDYD